MSNAMHYDDPGIIQLIFLMLDLVAGFLLVFVLIKAILLVLRYDTLKYYTVGIIA